MAITSRLYDPLDSHAGRFRTRLRYTFDDGRVSVIGPLHVDDSSHADQLLISLEPEVLLSQQEHDAEVVADADGDITGTTGQATEEQVARDYLKTALQTEDPYHAHRKLKKAQDYFQAKGWNPTQIKSKLNITDDQWDIIITRWQYLNADTATLDSYETIRANDPGIGNL